MFENKKILVLGMARSGYEAAKYLIKHGNTVILNDGGSEEKQKKEQVEELKELAKESKDATDFENKVKAKYPEYSGLNYLDMTAGFFFPQN